MTTMDRSTLDASLARALRERARDVGAEDELYRSIVAGATALPQLRRYGGWLVAPSRRTALVLAAALLGIALISAAVGAGLLLRRTSPLPTFRNGPIMILEHGNLSLVDPVTGADAGPVPQLPIPADLIADAAWSRDGRQLAVVRMGNLSIVDTDSGQARAVATCSSTFWVCAPAVRSMDWSPDGTTLAATAAGRLLLIDLATSEATTILDARDAMGWVGHPSWSPDGRRIAVEFVTPYRGAHTRDRSEILVVDRDGSNRRRLGAAAAPESIGLLQPTWSSDGTKLVFLTSDAWRDTGDASTSGWVMTAMLYELVDGEAVEPARKIADIGMLPCGRSCATITLSPDGSRIAIDRGEGVQILSIDGPARLDLGVRGRVLAWRPVETAE